MCGGNGICTTGVALGNASINPADYWPNVLYDTREGTYRDVRRATPITTCLGGMMNYVALDVGNLKRWLAPTPRRTTPSARAATQ